jgi:hypothetical protein
MTKTKGALDRYFGRLGYAPKFRRAIIKGLKRFEHNPEPQDPDKPVRRRRR